MPGPLGNSVNIHVCVDANHHAGNVVTRHSHIGILLFVQNSPIPWVSHGQDTVKTFGSEFVAIRTARDVISALLNTIGRAGTSLLRQPRSGQEQKHPRIGVEKKAQCHPSSCCAGSGGDWFSTSPQGRYTNKSC